MKDVFYYRVKLKCIGFTRSWRTKACIVSSHAIYASRKAQIERLVNLQQPIRCIEV